jgi:hypothetical protein
MLNLRREDATKSSVTPALVRGTAPRNPAAGQCPEFTTLGSISVGLRGGSESTHAGRRLTCCALVTERPGVRLPGMGARAEGEYARAEGTDVSQGKRVARSTCPDGVVLRVSKHSVGGCGV